LQWLALWPWIRGRGLRRSYRGGRATTASFGRDMSADAGPGFAASGRVPGPVRRFARFDPRLERSKLPAGPLRPKSELGLRKRCAIIQHRNAMRPPVPLLSRPSLRQAD